MFRVFFVYFKLDERKSFLMSFSRDRVTDFPFPRNRCDFRWAESCKKIRHQWKRYLIRFLITLRALQGDLLVITSNSRNFPTQSQHSRKDCDSQQIAAVCRKSLEMRSEMKAVCIFLNMILFIESLHVHSHESTPFGKPSEHEHKFTFFRGFFSLPEKIFSFWRRRLEKMMIEPYQKLNVWLVLDREDDA